VKQIVFVLVILIGFFAFSACDTGGDPPPGEIIVYYDFFSTTDMGDPLTEALKPENFQPVQFDPDIDYVVVGFLGVGGVEHDYYLCVTFQDDGDYVFSSSDPPITINFYIKETNGDLIHKIDPAAPYTRTITAGTTLLLHMYKGITGWAGDGWIRIVSDS
jgi:hypothetical protein